MGKATRWLKSLLGMKKEKENKEIESFISINPTTKENKRWSFHKPNTTTTTRDSSSKAWLMMRSPYIDTDIDTERERNEHAMAVAAATAKAADAAVAAAQAAVAVVRLTTAAQGRSGGGRERDYEREALWGSVVKVQSAFRGFLARKALRALKGLVKIQALVRGYLVRKRAAATLYSMQALFRAQASARSQRARRSINKENRFSNEFRGRRSMERFDEVRSEFHSKRLSTSYENSLSPFEESPKIVEIDTYKPRARSRRMSTPILDYNEDPYYQEISSPLPCPLTSKISTSKSKNSESHDWGFNGEEYKFSTAQSTPRFANSYKYKGPPTPSKSVCGDSLFRPYSNFPSYMANTQSFRAKSRSQSAPRQRVEIVSKKKMSLEEIMASRNSLSGVKMQRSCTKVQETLNL